MPAQAMEMPRSTDTSAMRCHAALRGLWGSAPAAHPANASGLSPIYHSRGGWPEGGSGHIRYALDQSRPWVAEYQAEAYTSPEVLDGLWLDCMGVGGFQSHDSCGGDVRGAATQRA